MLKLKLKDVVSAVVSAILVAFVGYLSNITNVSAIDFQQLGSIALLTGLTSLLKALATTDSGHFLGTVKIK